jgi:3-hydroxymyristoyl/3-hydroxydecanoyl-(acyl carrier protein) dehydratase
MVLKERLYEIKEQTQTDGVWMCRLSLDATHPIYRAHFPNYPVTPGVCIVQMAKELASYCYGKSFFLCGIRNVKFLHILNPAENAEIAVQLQANKADHETQRSITVSFRDGETVFASLILKLLPDDPPCLQARMEALHLGIVIPVYNNKGTVADVVASVLRQTRSVIVVNDGSTDGTEELLQSFSDRIKIISYSPNRGKGYALRRGFECARKLGYAGVITLDSDGQHDVNDLKTMLRDIKTHPDSLWVGERITTGVMPSGNSFANRFSNFWFTLQTGRRLHDTQNGFRYYPLKAMKKMRPFCTRYEAELELLVRAAWRGIPVRPTPVHVYYPPDSERVTHFRPGKDFLRISLLNTLLTLLAVVYGYPRLLFRTLFSKKQYT